MYSQQELLMPQQNYLAPFAAIETPGENPPLVIV